LYLCSRFVDDFAANLLMISMSCASQGLLLGMGCGLVTQLVTLTVIILRTDWDILVL
jgi:hypothetical protein